jgi:hypothetical protein
MPRKSLSEARAASNRVFNPKRKLAKCVPEAAALADLSTRATYTGNPQHKRNPGDFRLTPPSDPRLGKTLCDPAGVTRRAEALGLLRSGLRRGLISEQWRDGWPQNVWAVSARGIPFEAMLENPVVGSYHGYPMPESDPLRPHVLDRWTSWNQSTS